MSQRSCLARGQCPHPAQRRARALTQARACSRTTPLLLALLALMGACALQLVVLGLARAEDAAPVMAAPSAQEHDAPDSAYSRSVDAALIEYDRGNFEEAREHLRAAHEVYPNARTYRGLGKTEFELRNYGESVKLLEAALASPVKPLDQGLRAEVEGILTRAREYVGEVHVNVEPGTAIVSVDGVPVASGPDAALALVVGDHVLEFRASGHLPERRAIRVKGGDRIMVHVVLPDPAEHTSHNALPIRSQEQQHADDSARKRRWIWGSVGAVLVGGIVTGIVLATRPQDERTGETTGGTTGVVIGNP